MNAEKMVILKMLEDGKISSDEASKLLSSLDDNKNSYGNGTNNTKSSVHDVNWTKDLGKKVETIAKDLEPKLQKLTETVAEKTSIFAEKIAQSLASKPAKPTKPTKPSDFSSVAETPVSKSGKIERSFEYHVASDCDNELNITCLNGYIYLKGYNGDKITAKLIYEPKSSSAVIELLKLGSTYYLNYDNNEFKTISIEAYIPSSLFKNLQLETLNDKIAIDSINCGRINLYTEKGEINIKDVSSGNLKAETTNSKIYVKNLSGAFAAIENYNGSVEVISSDTATLKIEASNAPVNVLIPAFVNYPNYQWRIQTSNAKLKINVPTSSDTAFDLKAYTSLSEVVVGLTGLKYIQNEKNYIEAKSLNIDSAYRRVRLDLDTSNAQLVING